MKGDYVGNLVDGIRHGKGILTFANGDRYEGSFHKGFRHGFGVFTSERGGRIYEGEWKRSLKHGKGKERWTKSGDRYEGDYENDMYQGKGILFKGTSNSKYEGQFDKGRKHGYGRMEFPNPSRAIQTPSGSASNNNNSRPSSALKSVIRTASVVAISSNTKTEDLGSKAWYEGTWKDGRMHGEGRYTRSDGSFYEGTWIEGLAQGYGKEVIVKLGEVYEGNWKQGLRHGEGAITRNSKRRKGVWEMGQRIKWTTAELSVKKASVLS